MCAIVFLNFDFQSSKGASKVPETSVLDSPISGKWEAMLQSGEMFLLLLLEMSKEEFNSLTGQSASCLQSQS